MAEWIDNKQPTQMVEIVDEEEKLKCLINTSGQNRQAWFLTEDGLYEVLMQSRKPIAKAFKKEVKKILKINHGDSNARVLNKHIRSKILMKKTK